MIFFSPPSQKPHWEVNLGRNILQKLSFDLKAYLHSNAFDWCFCMLKRNLKRLHIIANNCIHFNACLFLSTKMYNMKYLSSKALFTWASRGQQKQAVCTTPNCPPSRGHGSTQVCTHSRNALHRCAAIFYSTCQVWQVAQPVRLSHVREFDCATTMCSNAWLGREHV